MCSLLLTCRLLLDGRGVRRRGFVRRRFIRRNMGGCVIGRQLFRPEQHTVALRRHSFFVLRFGYQFVASPYQRLFVHRQARCFGCRLLLCRIWDRHSDCRRLLQAAFGNARR